VISPSDCDLNPMLFIHVAMVKLASVKTLPIG
jgi:hypothetical protein